MAVTPSFWAGKSVFLTGHTGFKGGWLALWLTALGARVHGYALAPETTPNLFAEAAVAEGLASSQIADIRDLNALSAALGDACPEIVFHLAAQPLVRRSYAAPADTFSTNLMGVVNLFEAVRRTPTVRAVVNVTTDKCYENIETSVPYPETAPLGGYDPYSSSKACAELATAAYRRSFLMEAGIGVATARAGNVIGGGDWALDRLLPDFFRALEAGEAMTVRYPDAVRPWQHVLEPLSGYIRIAERLSEQPETYAQAWNFGPDDRDAQSVAWVLDRLKRRIPGADWRRGTTPQPHEAGLLKLDSAKARKTLGWRPAWDLETALDKTVAWRDAWRRGADMRAETLRQVEDYGCAAA